MDEREILIADRNTELRQHVAEFFRHEGYRVETTDSAVHVLCTILERQTPVVLLTNDFDRKVNSADLVHLLKKCNRKLSVIMVSDDMPIALARRLRQEGIFYHAMTPADPGDTAEIGQAVACAFDRLDAEPGAAQPSRPDPAPARKPGLAALLATAYDKEHDMKTARWLVSIGAMVLAALSYAFAAGEGKGNDGSIFVWIFFGMCALIILGQLLPLMRVIPRSAVEKAAAAQKAEALTQTTRQQD